MLQMVEFNMDLKSITWFTKTMPRIDLELLEVKTSWRMIISRYVVKIAIVVILLKILFLKKNILFLFCSHDWFLIKKKIFNKNWKLPLRYQQRCKFVINASQLCFCSKLNTLSDICYYFLISTLFHFVNLLFL